MEGQRRAIGSFQQRCHSDGIQIPLRGQTSDDEAVGTLRAQFPDLAGHLADLVRGIEKISCPGPHQAADGDVAFLPDLLQQGKIGCQPSDGQCAAQFDPVRTARYGSTGRG